MKATSPYRIALDTGGTFTDCIATTPAGEIRRRKVLSKGALRGEVIEVFDDGRLRILEMWGVSRDIFEGYTFVSRNAPDLFRRILGYDQTQGILRVDPPLPRVPTGPFEISAGEDATLLGIRLITETALGEPLSNVTVRLGTTRGTNALLERDGAKMVFLTTEGFGDVLSIGTQARRDIFAQRIERAAPLADTVLEVPERLGADGAVLCKLDPSSLFPVLEDLRKRGVDTAAVCFVNAYRDPSHEDTLYKILESLGFSYISLSHRLSKRMSFLLRARTAQVNAYLSPVITAYLKGLERSGIADVAVMGSAGGLVPAERFTPKDSLLSGPAGGCIGMAAVGEAYGLTRLIGFDMGGTSTDVSRFDGGFDYQYELAVGDGEIFSEALDIHTVAAGGGSICTFDGFKLRVGPKSAGADPGPACYGMGGPLCITDVNLLAGRLDPSMFAIPIDVDAASMALDKVLDDIGRTFAPRPDRAAAVAGFLAVADETMAGAVNTISAQKGFDTAAYAMVAFGGAGGLHACAVAGRLGIDTVILPTDSGILSAYGLLSAELSESAEAQVLLRLEAFEAKRAKLIGRLEKETIASLERSVGRPALAETTTTVFCRFAGQNSTLPISDLSDISGAFKAAYTQLFGHWREHGVIEVERISVTARLISSKRPKKLLPRSRQTATPTRSTAAGTPVFQRDALDFGDTISGPALLLDAYAAAFIDAGWRGVTDDDGTVILTRTEHRSLPTAELEAAALSLFANRFMFIADTMGETLRRTAVSVNVKERLDFSAAVLDAEGRLVANAHHIPVHLGALGVAVRRVTAAFPLDEGDVIVTNHPAFGGSHLPDVTVISPVFVQGRCVAYVANRAHHAELGGKTPGSMPPNARSLAEEGVIIPPFYLCRAGVWHEDRLNDVLGRGPYPSRAADDNLADIRAQVAANLKGVRDLRALADEVGPETLCHHFERLRDNAAAEMTRCLERLRMPCTATEYLDDGTPLCVTFSARARGGWTVDWTGSGGVHPGNLNGTEAVAASAVMYVLRLLLQRPVPLNDGLMAPIHLVLPRGLLNPTFDLDDDARSPAVAGGNTELSQRMVDVMIKALGLMAAGQGTMNNLLFGNDTFGYYETIGGGAGAGPGFHGQSGVHCHMTNTRITDVEVIEHRYPVRVERFSLRRGTGGDGAYRGGDGLVRAFCMLAPVTVSFIGERRRSSPFGMAGGAPGRCGKGQVIRRDGRIEALGGRASCELNPGDRIVIETPGGGGFGKP